MATGAYRVGGILGAGANSDNVYCTLTNSDTTDTTLYSSFNITPVPTAGMPPRFSGTVTIPGRSALAPGSYTFIIKVALRTGVNTDTSDSIRATFTIMGP